jgi:hypothetical protein
MPKSLSNHLIFALLISLLLAGCASPAGTPVATETATATPPPTSSPTFTYTPTPSSTPSPTITPTAALTYPPETRLEVQCLEILPDLPAGVVSNGVIILGERSVDQDRGYDNVLLDMTTGETTKISSTDEYHLKHVVSLDRKYIAYLRATYDKDGQGIFDKLVIANVYGKIQKEIPWEEKWADILTWTNDQRLIIAYDDPDLESKLSTPFAFLLLDPFSGEREFLLPKFPGYIRNAKIPYWDGWFGVKYDPTITRAIYPQMLSDTEEEEFYTYALWDVSNQKFVSSLENIYVDWVGGSISSPKPIWSEDGSHFAFVGHDYFDPIFELYQVSRDGQVEKLTNLTSIALFSDLPFSWSPDGRKIAMLLDIHPEVDGENVLILDLETKNITDICITVNVNPFTEDYLPIWSPDGQQFLVKDWLDDKHNRIILVDTNQGFAVQIAENGGINGWMVSPRE